MRGASVVLGIAACSVAAYGLFVSLKPSEYRLSAYATSLNNRSRSQQANAERALNKLNGATIPPEGTFSFNKRVGSFSRDDGYRRAPVSYNGQLISSWGGGVCQASTTLYNAALLAGMKITERTRHDFCPQYVPLGLDAAVAYPDIDLKFSNPYPFPVTLKTRRDGSRLLVEFYGSRPLPAPVTISRRVQPIAPRTVFLPNSEGANPGRRLRTVGLAGGDTLVLRTIGKRTELISEDFGQAMNRVVENP